MGSILYSQHLLSGVACCLLVLGILWISSSGVVPALVLVSGGAVVEEEDLVVLSDGVVAGLLVLSRAVFSEPELVDETGLEFTRLESSSGLVRSSSLTADDFSVTVTASGRASDSVANNLI